MPSYESKFLDCEKTIESYSARYEEATGYDRWMISRRESDFVLAQTLQRMNIHSVLLGVGGSEGYYDVCSCGLRNYTDHANHLVRGHLFNGKSTRLIIVWQEELDGHVLYCQDCEENWLLVSKGEFGYYDLPDVDLEATMAKHSICAKPTMQLFEPDR